MDEIKAILADLEKLQDLVEEQRESTAELKRMITGFQESTAEAQSFVEEFLQSRQEMRKNIEEIRQTLEDMRYRIEWEKIHFRILRSAAMIRSSIMKRQRTSEAEQG